MRILSLMKIADIFTVGNLCCGILSILLAIDGLFDLSALLLFLAAVFDVLDVLDGKIAGLLHQKNSFGKQIDSMSDLVSLGVAPALLFYSLSTPGVLGIIVTLFFVACGMLRLARYNISGSRYFCESFYEHPCPTSGKNYATANACGGPSRPGHSIATQQGVAHMLSNDSTRFRKACIFTSQAA